MKLGEWFSKQITILLTVLGVTGSVVYGIVSSVINGNGITLAEIITFLILVVLSILFGAIAIKKEKNSLKEIKKLKDENEELSKQLNQETTEVKRLTNILEDKKTSNKLFIRSFLQLLYEELGFNHHHRIMLWGCLDSQERLIILERFSDNPDFLKQERERLMFSNSSLLILHKAMVEGEKFFNINCSYESNPAAYKKQMKNQYKIDGALVDSFDMHSRSVGMVSLKKLGVRGNKRVLFVFESMNYKDLDRAKIFSTLGRYKEFLTIWYDNFYDNEPEISTDLFIDFNMSFN